VPPQPLNDTDTNTQLNGSNGSNDSALTQSNAEHSTASSDNGHGATSLQSTEGTNGTSDSQPVANGVTDSTALNASNGLTASNGPTNLTASTASTASTTSNGSTSLTASTVSESTNSTITAASASNELLYALLENTLAFFSDSKITLENNDKKLEELELHNCKCYVKVISSSYIILVFLWPLQRDDTSGFKISYFECTQDNLRQPENL
jgi:hypothetical protein